MFLKICVTLIFVIPMPAWSQAAPSATGLAPASDDRMQTPPPVSGKAYPTGIVSEARSNYVRARFAFSPAYNDNVLAGTSSTPISDVSYSIWPTISLDQTTPRMHQSFAYSPGFTFYQHTSGWNEQSQNLNYDSQYQLSPYITLGVQDEFLKSSNILNQPNPLSEVTVPGSAQSPAIPVVAPFADQLNNNVNFVLTYQLNRDDMVGGSGIFTYLHYPNPNQVPGLYDSNSHGGTGFYNHRLASDQYAGVTYQYIGISDSPPTSQIENKYETQIYTMAAFYTLYLQPQLSVSLSVGPQHYHVIQSPSSESRGWTPTFMASLGWQEPHVAVAAGYSQSTGGGGGLIGLYHTNSASLSFQWQLERTWLVGAAGNYVVTNNVSSDMGALNPGGSSASGAVGIHHPISEHIYLDFGYSRLHQNYPTISAISNIPNSDRIYGSISYQFIRPLGR